MNTIINNLSEVDKNKSFVTIYKDGAEFDIKISDLLAILSLSSLQISASVDGSNGIYILNTSAGVNAGSQLLLGNNTGASAQWYSGSSNSSYGANVLFLRQIKNAPFRFISDSGNSFYFGTDLDGNPSFSFLTITSTQTNITSALHVGSAGTITPSAVLELKSTTKGFLPPQMTTAEINAIATPAEGLQVYNTTIKHMCFYMNGAWQKINHSNM
jgi:hypothetical protein